MSLLAVKAEILALLLHLLLARPGRTFGQPQIGLGMVLAAEQPRLPAGLFAHGGIGHGQQQFGIGRHLRAVRLQRVERTGRGQFVDVAMSDGVLYLLASSISGYFASGKSPEAGGTALNGSLPQYNVYQCQDGGWISLGSLEGHFWANLCRVLGCEDFIPHEYDSAKREEIFAYFREQFKTKTRDEWFELMKKTDICAAPVYALDEALDRRKFLSFLAAGVVAASLPLPIAFPNAPVRPKQFIWIAYRIVAKGSHVDVVPIPAHKFFIGARTDHA